MRCRAGQSAVAGGAQHGVDRAAHLLERGRLGDRGLEAGPHLGDDRLGLLAARRLGAEHLGQGAVHLGGASPSARAGPAKSVPASAACSATRQASSTPGRNSWAKAR